MKKRIMIVAVLAIPSLMAQAPSKKQKSEVITQEVTTFIEAQGEALAAFLESCSHHEFFNKIGFTQKDLQGNVTHLSGAEARDQIVQAGKKLASMGAQAATFLHDSIETMQEKIEEKMKEKNAGNAGR